MKRRMMRKFRAPASRSSIARFISRKKASSASTQGFNRVRSEQITLPVKS